MTVRKHGLIFVVALSICGLSLSPPVQSQEQTTPRPQDDFYSTVNGEWLATTPIPPEVPWISPFVVNTLRVQDRVKQLIEAAATGTPIAGTDAQRIGDLYRSYMDETRIEAEGLLPLQADFARIDAISSPEALTEGFAQLARAHADFAPFSRSPNVTPIGIAVLADAHDATRAVVTLQPGGLGLPERTYYLDQAPTAASLRAAYHQHIDETLRLSGVVDHAGAAARIIDLETALARAALWTCTGFVPASYLIMPPWLRTRAG